MTLIILRALLTVLVLLPSAVEVKAFSFDSIDSGIRMNTSASSQILSVLASYVGCVAYLDRPRGDIISSLSTTVVKPSHVSGLGLFAASDFSKDTILGTYPGVLRPIDKYVHGKLQQYPISSEYVWRFTDNKMVIDPTDEFGILKTVCLGGSSDWFGSYFMFNRFQLFGKDTRLARINEPPISGDCNIYVMEDIRERTITFVTSRQVLFGEEFYVDYGKIYDRSYYFSNSKGKETSEQHIHNMKKTYTAEKVYIILTK